jgi:glucose/arabinose dehydrogenase
MWAPLTGGLLALVLAAQVVDARACRTPQPSPAPSPSPSPSPPPASDVFTTQDGIRFRVETVAEQLQVPWSLAFAPDGRLFVSERPGRVRILDLTARTSALALTLTDVFATGEAGALGLALDPDFTQNRLVYLYYTAVVAGGGTVNRVVRYRESANRLIEAVPLLDNIPAAAIHDGGRIRVGPDGLLYITAGDADTRARAQDLASYAGKILRLNRDGTTPRANPFGSPIYSYGHRNPQGIDWHPLTGELWASEHGQSANDEINLIRSGANYGWPEIEGSASRPGMEPPIVFYASTLAPSGISFYRGQRIPGFTNDLFVAALRGTELRRLRTSGARVTAQEALVDDRFGRIRDVVTGPDGYLYFCTNNRDSRGNPAAADDRILRIVPAV